MYSGDEIIKTQLETGNYPAVKCGDINSGLPLQFQKCISFVNPDLIKNKKYFEYGDILISNVSNKLDTLGKTVVYLGNKKCLAGDSITIIKHNQNPKYLSHALSSYFCKNQIKKLAKSGTIFHIWNSGIKKIKIPLPTLKEQERIVSILDKFHTLCGDIEQGIPILIEKNKKQYEYYKEEILKN